MEPFSEKELEYLIDQQFLLTKRKINEKLYHLLEELEVDLKKYVVGTGFPFPKGTLLKSGKISHGENYKGLPYIVLDYPRLFTKKSTFAYRSMIWWGNYFSTTLHLSGEAKDFFAPRLLSNFNALKSQDFYICINSDPWKHHFEPDNYQHISEISIEAFESQLQELDFIKLSNKISIEEYKHFKEFAINQMNKFFSYLLT